jgi:hypothetical protein
MIKMIVAGILGLSIAANAGEVDRRAARQQERIAEGMKSGQLTEKESARLEKREAKIDGEIARDRAANGGKLTPAERRKVNREQNRASRAIYRQKHDTQHQ